VLSCHDVASAGNNPLAAFAYPRTGKRGVPQQFPRRLYEMLEIESNNCTTVDATGMGYEIPLIAWSDTGRAFRIADVQLFATLILPKYFRTSKFSSFQRNLNLYGFTKVRRGPETDMYAHPEFIRGQVDSLVKLRKLKTTERKSAKGPKGTSSVPSSSSSSSSSSSLLSQQHRGKVAEPKRGPDVAGVVTSPRIVSPSPSKLLRQSSGSSSTSSCSSSSLMAPSEQMANAGNSSQQQQVMHGISIPSLLQQYQRQRLQEYSRNTFQSAAHITSQWAERQVEHERSVSLPPLLQHNYSAPPPSLPTLLATSVSADYSMPPLALPSTILQEQRPLSLPQQHHGLLPQAPISAAAPAEPRDISADAKTGGKLALLALAMTSMEERS